MNEKSLLVVAWLQKKCFWLLKVTNRFLDIHNLVKFIGKYSLLTISAKVKTTLRLYMLHTIEPKIISCRLYASPRATINSYFCSISYMSLCHGEQEFPHDKTINELMVQKWLIYRGELFHGYWMTMKLFLEWLLRVLSIRIDVYFSILICHFDFLIISYKKPRIYLK